MAVIEKGTFRLITAAGFLLLGLAGYATVRHREVLEVEGLELEGLPPAHVLLLCLAGTLLAAYGGLGMLATFRPIRRSLDVTHDDSQFRPSFLAFGPRADKKVAEGYKPDYLDALDLIKKRAA